jgi:PAS domain-containing protein
MLDRPETIERLREALISLERSRRRARELRDLEACMAEVVRVLALADHPRETFDSLIETLRGVLPFQEAAVVARGPDGTFRPAARSCEWLAALRLSPERMLTRVLEGEIVVMFDASLAPEWRAQEAEVRERVRSVIHVALRSGDAAVLLVCTHAEPARFQQQQVDVVKRLVPLAGQILQKLDLREILAEREHERHARLAMFNAIINHIQAGVLIEDHRRRVFAANDRLREMFGDEALAGSGVGTDAVALHAQLARLAACPEAFAARATQLVRERVPVSGEAVRLTDGRVVERDYVPVATADAGLIGHFWQYRDITARASLLREDRPARYA